ncbi:GNAT family N-acetyltransferase [Actinoplanes couchii]|uniref:N-acetyltransferase domain-containing protein n=1 Tax=Actinoplanes couchii TaxID=403638 RepID=A0ABQ3XG28_9ACTN|nr:GNAT family N-acetyltransferase [Actinoplanes couchii]MDR6320878.1 ribosomal protein S18 acetylase RimI-like enzyme [Actinoplanes couchii]GID57390.1 hypothetical protein Aco03nite_057940 [Actinoplanes couchii]
MTRAAQIEEHAASAWPATHNTRAGGWILRHTPGVTKRRNNSALPTPSTSLSPSTFLSTSTSTSTSLSPSASLSPSTSASASPSPSADELPIGVAETYYRSKGLPVTVQVSPAEEHTALDATLAALGYRHDAPTLVLTAPVTTVATAPTTIAAPTDAATAAPTITAAPTNPATAAPTTTTPTNPAAGSPTTTVTPTDPAAGSPTVAATPADAVPVDAFVEITGLTPAWRAAYGNDAVSAHVLDRIDRPAGFVSITVDGEIVALGLFVAGDGLAGIFCMATDPQHRRRGHAAAILRAGAAWSAGQGAELLYLQVEEDNTPARRLYEGVGFTHSHSYHYRVRDTWPEPVV